MIRPPHQVAEARRLISSALACVLLALAFFALVGALA